MVQISKTERKAVYRYILQEGVIVVHKDFTTQPHKGTNVPNLHLRKIMRSLKDRGYVELVFSWQHFYYFINNEGKKFLSDFLNLTEEVVPLTWKYLMHHLERTKKDSTNTLLRTRAEESEEKGPKVDVPRVKEREAEVPPEEEKRAKLISQLQLNLHQPHDLL